MGETLYRYFIEIVLGTNDSGLHWRLVAVHRCCVFSTKDVA